MFEGSLEHIPDYSLPEGYLGCRTEMLPGRMFFVEDATGQRVATATAFFDIYGRKQPGRVENAGAAGWNSGL